MENRYPDSISTAYGAQALPVSDVLRGVYAWMTAGLLVTAATAAAVAQTPALAEALFRNSAVFWGLLITELAVVLILSATLRRLSYAVATGLFLGYAFLNGLTLSLVFLLYTRESIAATFGLTAGVFGAMSLYGFTTRRDLTGVGSFSIMALIGLILASIFNAFLASSTLDWLLTYAGIAIFVGLTAYDTQKIKRLAEANTGLSAHHLFIMGALTLYLDFINLFLRLLRLFGRRS